MGERKIVIIGGVAGGMSAAARIRRLDERAEILVLEKSGYVSFANCGLPYFLGREIPKYEDLLLQTPEGLASRFRIDVRVKHTVTSISPEQQIVEGVQSGGAPFQYPYDELIISVGGRPIVPPLPGLDTEGVFTLRNMEDTARIDHFIEDRKPKNAVVVGGGYIGVEMAEQLHRRGLTIHLVEAAPQILAPFDSEMAQMAQDELERQGVVLHLNSPLKGVFPGGGLVGTVRAGAEELQADLVVLGLGVRPDSELAAHAGAALGPRGGIKVSPEMKSSIDHVWAVGDVVEVTNPISGEDVVIALGGPANRQGRIVANNICGIADRYDGTLGTAILRVFDYQAAATGLKESQLQAQGRDYEVIYLHPKHHAGYYPGAETISLKMLFCPKSGKIYGAQAFGKAGVDKRMDVIATALKSGLTAPQLADLELCYAPPFGSAKDPINLAGMMAENVMSGLLCQIQWHELQSLDLSGVTLLDVRSPAEVEKGTIAGSVAIPLSELRTRLDEIPTSKPVIAYCQSGQRSYFATRYLTQKGYQARNLSGAYLTYSGAAGVRPASTPK